MQPPKIQATALLRNETMRRVERGYMFRVCLLGFGFFAEVIFRATDACRLAHRAAMQCMECGELRCATCGALKFEAVEIKSCGFYCPRHHAEGIMGRLPDTWLHSER